jgi:hypothetical protein
MNCCDANGNCNQGRDCPIRKQRTKETNEAYINQNNGLEPDILDDVADTFKALIAFMAVVAKLKEHNNG